jgi:hypothetical protein
MAWADGPHDHNDHGKNYKAELTGYQEALLAISTTGDGSFKLRVNPAGTELTYELRYSDLEGTVTQAHIHFGAKGQTGGISAFLCTNLGNAPASPPAQTTQACPPAPATITGTIIAGDVIGPAGQGIGPGQLSELIDAIREGVAYANVHSTLYPGGEIRGQLRK